MGLACVALARASVTASGGGPPLHDTVVPLVGGSYIVGPPLAGGLRAAAWVACALRRGWPARCGVGGLRAAAWVACVARARASGTAYERWPARARERPYPRRSSTLRVICSTAGAAPSATTRTQSVVLAVKTVPLLL